MRVFTDAMSATHAVGAVCSITFGIASMIMGSGVASANDVGEFRTRGPRHLVIHAASPSDGGGIVAREVTDNIS